MIEVSGWVKTDDVAIHVGKWEAIQIPSSLNKQIDKVGTLFKLHLATTLTCVLCSIYVAIPKVSALVRSAPLDRIYRRNTLLFTAAIASSFFAHYIMQKTEISL